MFDRPRSGSTTDSVRPLRVTEPPPPYMLPNSKLPGSNLAANTSKQVQTTASSNAERYPPITFFVVGWAGKALYVYASAGQRQSQLILANPYKIRI